VIIEQALYIQVGKNIYVDGKKAFAVVQEWPCLEQSSSCFQYFRTLIAGLLIQSVVIAAFAILAYTGPDVRVFAHLTTDSCTLYIDSSGEPLFKRGWRQDKGDAPLKETLAAAMLAASGWWNPETGA